MKRAGITLIELVVAASIIAILAAAIGFTYEGWLAGYRIESDTKELYSDLMEARTMAMTRKRMHFAVLNTGNYQVYEDTNNNNVPEPGTGDNPVEGFANPKPVHYPLSWKGTIPFTTEGVRPSAAAIVIRLERPPRASPEFDCLVVSPARIRTGLWSGGTCVQK